MLVLRLGSLVGALGLALGLLIGPGHADPALDGSPSPAPAAVATASASSSLEALLELPEAPRPRPLILLHSNDGYGRLDPLLKDPYHLNQPGEVGGILRAESWIQAERARGTPLLLLSAGNVLGPDMLAAASQGRSIVQVMNRLGYDAWLPSLYDFGYGLDVLQERIRESSASVVLTNVRWSDGGGPLAAPYAVFHRGGLCVAVVGLADRDLLGHLDYSEQARLVVDPPLEALKRWLPTIRREATPDAIIALTHLTLDEEMPLLSRDSGLDLLIGGFNSSQPTTVAVHELVGLDGKRALHAGTFGTSMGKVRITFEPDPAGSYRLGRLEPDVVRLDDEVAPRRPGATSDLRVLIDQLRRTEARHWHRDHGDLAWLAEGRATGSTMVMVAEIMRLRARTEVGIVPRGFFHPEQVYGPITSAKSLFYAMPWEDALTVTQVPGDRLAALFRKLLAHGSPAAFLAGMALRNDRIFVNGRELDPQDLYTVATTWPAATGRIEALAPLSSGEPRALPVSVRRAVIQYFRDQARIGKTVSPEGFPDYYHWPFWKSSLQFTTDLQSRAVDTAGHRYPDLAWKADKSGMSWGGDLIYLFGTAWGAHQLEDTLNLSYHSDQLAEGQSQTSSDKIQFISDYRADILSTLLSPFATLTLTTRFLNDPPPPFFLAQMGAGVSHLWGSLELREGVEYRHHVFDPTQLDKTGGTLSLGYRGMLGWFEVNANLKLFATPQLATDGLLIDSESRVALPLTESTSLTYLIDAYRNTLYPDWAMRHLVGLTLKLSQPWLF